MSLPKAIGPYEIERELGRGGMGVVYLGRDERLGRRVAIKALPESSADSAEFVARFEREGRVLASLNHPNVASVFGIEEEAGTRYLVMEFVEGETLGAMLRRGPIPVDEALSIAAQIAAGMEAAHEAGVVHRDLKPGNVIVTPAGRVKVLDFGLAKGGAEPGTSFGVRRTDPESPTVTIASGERGAHSPVTMPGRIMGSAGYLSPEQARGKTLDRRTDIFSFGCVLFECLTGKMAFGGETLSDTIAATLEREPRWEALPANTPPRIRDLLTRCLEKDQSKRLRDIGDARLELEKSLSGREWASSFISSQSAFALPAARRGSWRAAAWFLAGLALGGVGGVTAATWMEREQSALARLEPRYFSIAMPEGMEAREGLVSPDGRTLAFIASERASPGRTVDPANQGVLFLRPFTSAEGRRVQGSHEVADVCFSPDSRWFAFRTRVGGAQPTFRIVKAPVDGRSPPVVLSSSDDLARINSLVWLGGDVIVAASGSGELVLLSSLDGKESRRVKVSGAGDNASLRMLADSGNPRYVLAHVTGYGPKGFEMNACAIDLETGESRVLVESAGAPAWDGGHRLFFTRSDQLLSVEFDPAKLETRGEVRSVLSGLRTGSAWEHANVTISADGTGCFVPGGVTGARRRMMVGKPDGTSEPWCADYRPFENSATVSPDGNKVIATIAESTGLYEMWISDAPGASFRRLAGRPSEDLGGACFSPDSSRVYFGAFGRVKANNAFYSMMLNARSEPTLLKACAYKWFMFTSIDSGGTAMYFSVARDDESVDLVRLALTPQGEVAGDPEVLVTGEPFAMNGGPSPDGRLLAFTTVEQSISHLQVARVGAEGIQGLPVVMASSETGLGSLGWARAANEKRIELCWATDSTIEYQPINGETGAVDGPRRSIPRPARVAVMGDGNGFGDGRFLYIEKSTDEEPPGVLTIVTRLTAVGEAEAKGGGRGR